MAPIIAGAAAVSEGRRSSSNRPVTTEVIGATDAGPQLLGGDPVEDPGRLLVGLAVLEGIRLVGDDLSVSGGIDLPLVEIVEFSG